MDLARACIPYTPFKRTLKESRLTLVTTAGLYVEGMEPFAEDDLSVRLIPGDAVTASLRLVPGHYDIGPASVDPNCVFPIDILREMLAAGEIARISDYHVSMGFTQQLRKLKEDVAGSIAETVAKARPDVVVLTGG